MAYAGSTTVSCVAESLTRHGGLCNSRNGPSAAPVPPRSYRQHIGVRHVVPSLRGPPGRPVTGTGLGRGAHIADPAAAGRRGRGAAGQPGRHDGPPGALAARPVRPGTAPTHRPRRASGSAPGRPGTRAARRFAAQPGRQRGVEPADRRGRVVRGTLPHPGPRPGVRPAQPRRTPVPGTHRGPPEAHRDGHGLPRRRPAHRRRVPRGAPRRERTHRAHDGRARPRRRRQHRIDVGGAAGRRRTAPQSAGGERDP